MMDEKKFNKWFSAFILVGMSCALLFTTAYKLGTSDSGKTWLIVAAFGSLMGILSSVCSANGNILTFLFGLLDVSIYGAMCFLNWHNGSSGLGNAVLHFVYFVPMQFVGFFQWRKRSDSHSGELKARRFTTRQWMIYTLVFVLASVIFYFVISAFDKSSAESFIKMAVILDVLPLVCNILGQYLMSTAYMEQWLFWIGVNVFSIMMWSHTLSQNGDSYSLIYVIKYSFYLVNSLNGLRIWLRLSRDNHGVCK